MSSPLLSSIQYVAPLASIVVYMSPIPTIQMIGTNRSVGTLPLLPYSSMVASTYLWLVYGILTNQPSIWTSNVGGLLLGLYYFVSFQKYSPKASSTLPGSIQQHLLGVASIVTVATLLPLVLPKTIYDPTKLVGQLGVVLCLALFASPLTALKTVIATKSARSIPLPFCIASVINCLLWTILGLFEMHDMNVWFPNGLGLLFGIIQILLKLYYYNANDDSINNNKKQQQHTFDAV